MGKYNALAAMIIIAGLEVFALTQGVDGVVFGGAVAIIAGLGGYTAKAKQ